MRDNVKLVDDVLLAVSHHCPLLTCLDVSVGGPAGGRITDDGLIAVITRCQHLSTLSVSRLSQVTDCVLLALAAEGRLTSLAAKRCEQLTDTGVTSLLGQCLQLEFLDVTGCFHVTNTSLTAAIDVIQTSSVDHPPLTVCLGGTSVELQDVVLPDRLVVEMFVPYGMLNDWQIDFDSDESRDDNEADDGDEDDSPRGAAADDDDGDDVDDGDDDDWLYFDNDDPLNAERWNLS